MDKHLNLFYSYDRGSRKDLDHLKQLEDNITRSFIITVMKLSEEQKLTFLNNLLDDSELKTKKKLNFDLQNIDDKSNNKIIKNAKNKILLCISREKSNIDLSSFQQKDRDIIRKIAKIKKDENEKDKILKRIKLEYKSFFKNNKFTYEVEELNEKIGDKITEDNINDIYQMLIQKSRPDAWIFNKDIAILIEAKIGSGKVFKAQLFRHLTKSFGFNDGQIFDKDKRPQKLELITTTWEKVVEELSKLKDSGKTFIKDFKEYMNMTGQTLNFEKFFHSQNNDVDERWGGVEPKDTLRILKDKLNNCLEEHGLDFEKREQVNETRMNYYWLRLFEIKSPNSPIHWRGTIYLNPDEVSVDVLAFDPKQKNFKAIFEKILEVANDLEEHDKLRTWVSIRKYGKRVIAQKGRDYDYCSLNYNVGEGSSFFKNTQNLIDFAKSIKPKQIGMKFSISSPGSNAKHWNADGKNINYQDAELLKNPVKIVDKFSSFINLSLDKLT